MTARPVGPGRAEWLAATRFDMADGRTHAPIAEPQCPTCAAAEAWAARAQRRLDEERRRGAALVAVVRADCESRENEGAGGMNTLPVELRAALAAYEGSAES